MVLTKNAGSGFSKSLIQWCVDSIDPGLDHRRHLIDWHEKSSESEVRLRFNSLTPVTVVRGILTISFAERSVGGEMEWSYDATEGQWQVDDENIDWL